MTNPTHWPFRSDITGIHQSQERWNAVRDQRIVGELSAAVAFRHALIADGWNVRPTYSHEPVTNAFTAERDGLKVSGITRTGKDEQPGRCLPTGSINAWGSDGISLSPLPVVYPGFEAMKVLQRHCPECGANDVDTVRVAFANRACKSCAPALRAKLETPGWCN